MRRRFPAVLILAVSLLPSAAFTASSKPSREEGGVAADFLKSATLLSTSDRKGPRYRFRTLVYERRPLSLKLDTVSPLDQRAAARRAASRLDVYRQLTSPYRLDYATAADVEREAHDGEFGVFPGEGCGAFGAAFFAADPAGARSGPAGQAAKPAVAGFLYDRGSLTFTEAVLVFPAGTPRLKALAEFRSLVCGRREP